MNLLQYIAKRKEKHTKSMKTSKKHSFFFFLSFLFFSLFFFFFLFFSLFFSLSFSFSLFCKRVSFFFYCVKNTILINTKHMTTINAFLFKFLLFNNTCNHHFSLLPLINIPPPNMSQI